jgi:hypothetical protein
MDREEIDPARSIQEPTAHAYCTNLAAHIKA